MGLDEELETIEDGAETEAEQIDQETELEDVEGFQNDEEFDPSDDETDLEEAYEGFFAEECPDGEGETSLDGEDEPAAVASQAAGIDLSEEGFHRRRRRGRRGGAALRERLARQLRCRCAERGRRRDRRLRV
ncbi:MAG: hypothetical protein ACLR3C_12970 [Eggerthella lenta]